MTCPTCHKKTRVIDSRSRGNEIRRRRVCADGHRCTTVEKVTSCPSGQTAYRTKDRAIYSLRAQGKIPYKCDLCGQWHLTPMIFGATPHSEI
jgi:hypothetical protein